MTSVSVLVPFQPDPRPTAWSPTIRDGASRQVIFHWVRERWEALYPDFEFVTVGSDTREMNRSAARNECFRRSSGDVVVIADADVVFHCGQVDDALRLIDEEGYRWVIGFDRYEQLTGPDTRMVLERDPVDDIARPDKPRWSTDQGNAGLLVMTREAFVVVNGYDERFTAYGYEDWAIANALHTVVHPLVTVPGYVLHLRHPVSPNRKQQKMRMMPVWTKYDLAFGRPEEMRAVLNDPHRLGL